MKVDVPRAAASVGETPDGLAVTIPARKSWFLILFLGFWICGWAFGEVAAIRQLLLGKTQGSSNLFLLAWLGGWAVGGSIAIYVWLWHLVGKEIAFLGPVELAIKQDILGFGKVRAYTLNSVTNLRVNPVATNYLDSWNVSLPWMKTGAIAFDYGARTFRFGSGIDEPEARQVIEVFKSRHQFA